MKSLCILLSALFFLVSCRDVEQSDIAKPLNVFEKIEKKVFISEKEAHRYLTINGLDSFDKRVAVESYYEKPSDNMKSDINIKYYYCDNSGCFTQLINKLYYEIKVEGLNKIFVNEYSLDKDGNSIFRSISTYKLIED